MQDEIFHVPQTQKYCRGLFTEWDPKITTFPGLYVAGAALGRTHHHLLSLLGGSAKVLPANTNLLESYFCFTTMRRVVSSPELLGVIDVT